MRGDIHQQRVVYTIAKRFKHSEYDITRANAKRVYDICNSKQNKFKEESRQLNLLRDEIKRITPDTMPVIVRRKTRRITSDGRH